MTTPPNAVSVRVYVSARGNRYMTDIAAMIAEAASTTRPATVVTDELPAADGAINLVVAPHEFFELSDASRVELQRAAACSVCIGTEQPGTPWFRLSLDALRRGLFSLDINRGAVRALRTEGIADAHHLQLGATPSLDHVERGRGEQARTIDALFLGSLDDRRGEVLAALAPALWNRASEFRLFSFDHPVDEATPGMLFGPAKSDLLARSRVLVNVHRDVPGASGHEPYFEWVRMIEAMANGCAVLTEPSIDHEPLVPGEHFVVSDATDMAAALTGLLEDDSRRSAVVGNAHRMVTRDLSLAAALPPILGEIERHVLPRIDEHIATGRYRRGPWRFGETRDPVRRLGPFRPYAPIQRRAKQLALAENTALRRLDTARCLLRFGEHRHVRAETTPGYDNATPHVTAVVTVYNYGDVVAETLESLLASTDVEIEVVVVEDHATDHSRDAIRSVMTAHREAAILLLAKDCNEGLAAARNDGFAAARSEFVMVMDADNHVYPTCLSRLRATLLDEPDAAAAYAILEDFGSRRGLRSAFDWDVERLCRANYIDAQAMWRTSEFEQLGGYRDDDAHVFGWEDWDLWLRLAASGGHARLRREVLGRYRVQPGSMIALTNLETDDAIAAQRLRHPTLPWPSA